MEPLKEEFKTIAAFESDVCVSIYIPVHRYGVEVNQKQDAIMLKNKLRQAKNRMAEKGLEQSRIEDLLKEGSDLVERGDFWNEQMDGLALFMAEGYFNYIKMNVVPKEVLLVNNTFYVIPLLELMEREEHFYLLLLSRDDARFYKANAFNMQEVKVEGLPNGINDVIHYEEKGGKQLMRRSGAGAGTNASRGASFHGHGAGTADDTEYLLQYLKEVDQTLWTKVLSTQKYPLLLAGVAYILAHYKQVSRYPFIEEETLIGNMDREDEQALYERARNKMESYFEARSAKALETYYNHSSSSGLSSSVPEEVIPASFYGKVSDLFIGKDEHIWGNFNETDNQLIIHDQQESNDICLINKAAVNTLNNGGDVHVLETDKMPQEAKLAAFMRY